MITLFLLLLRDNSQWFFKMLFCSLGASEYRWESLELKFKKRRLNTSIFYALCLCHSLNYQNFLKPFLVEFFFGVGKVDVSEGCMRGTSLDVKPPAFSSAKLAWRRVMPCMRQIISWLLAEVFNSLSSYHVVWLKARVSQDSETAAMKFWTDNGLVYLAIGDVVVVL